MKYTNKQLADKLIESGISVDLDGSFFSMKVKNRFVTGPIEDFRLLAVMTLGFMGKL